MKRCPECQHAYSDDVKFCRTDGASLVYDFDSEAGTVKLQASKQVETIETRILPTEKTLAGTDSRTGEALKDESAQTNLLNARRGSGDTKELSKQKTRKRTGVIIIALIAVALVAGLSYYFLSGKSSNKAIESIAVLPFQNVSNDPNTEYLSDGITESLINSLSQLPNVKVIARASSFRYKGKDVDLQQVAKDLNVQAVMTGRIVERGDTLDISVDLTDTQNNTQLWGQHYTRKMTDLFAVQDEIAGQVTDALKVKLTGAQREQVTKRYTENEEAYKLYLQGEFYLNKHTVEAAHKAADYFKQAIALDQNYALAYTGLSDAYDQLAGSSGEPPAEVYTQARAAVMQALKIDNNLAEAHTSLSYIKLDYDWDFKGAESELLEALRLNPNNAVARDAYGGYLMLMRRLDEALVQIKRAEELDPLSPYISKHIGTYLLFTHQYDRAIGQLRRTLELDPNFAMTYYDLGFAYDGKGMHSEVIAQFQKMLELDKDNDGALSGLGYTYALWGKPDEARKMLKKIEDLSARQYVSFSAASVYAGLGDKDHAIEWLEKGYEQRDANMINLKMHPAFEKLLSDQRYQDLMRRVGLPQ